MTHNCKLSTFWSPNSKWECVSYKTEGKYLDFLNLAIGRLTLISVMCGVNSNLFVTLTLSDVWDTQERTKLEQTDEIKLENYILSFMRKCCLNFRAKNDLFSGDSMVDLSPGSIIACNVKGQSGCDGGSTDRAWNFLRKYGWVLSLWYAKNQRYKMGISCKCVEFWCIWASKYGRFFNAR